MFYKVRLYLFIITVICLLNGLQAIAAPFKTDTNAVTTDAKAFIKPISSKNTVFVGEPFIVKYQLYIGSNIEDPETIINAKFLNCYQDELPSNRESHDELIKGVKYTVVVIKQYLVIANHEGKVEIPRIKIQLKTSVRDTTSFFPREIENTKDYYSAVGSVTVNPLPVNADTTLFSGAIGSFKIKGNYQPTKKNPNMLLFKLFIDGTGYTKNILISNPHYPVGMEVYNPNTVRHDTLTQDGIKTHVEYTFQLVANYKGRYVIPGVSFTVFNLQTGKYEKFNSGDFTWDVVNGPTLVAPTRVVPVKTNDFFTKDTLINTGKHYFYASLLFKFLLVISFLLLIYIYQMAFFEELLWKYLELIKLKINKRETIKNINKLIIDSTGLQDDEFWKKLNLIFFTYLRKEARIDDPTVSDLSIDLKQFSNRLPKSVFQQINQFLFNLQSMRFNAVPIPSVDRVKSCDQLINIVNAIDSNWHE